MGANATTRRSWVSWVTIRGAVLTFSVFKMAWRLLTVRSREASSSPTLLLVVACRPTGRSLVCMWVRGTRQHDEVGVLEEGVRRREQSELTGGLQISSCFRQGRGQDQGSKAGAGDEGGETTWRRSGSRCARRRMRVWYVVLVLGFRVICRRS